MDSNAGSAIGVVFAIIGIAWYVLQVVAMWKIFSKAGVGGWKCLIPIFNYMTVFKIAYGSYGKAFMTLIPVFGEILAIALWARLGQSFGQNVGFRLGLIFLNPIFLIILGFGKAEYVGPIKATL